MYVCALFYSGLHQAIIHNKPTMLNRLLDFVAQYPQLEQSINDQNALFQVGGLAWVFTRACIKGGLLMCLLH